MKSVAILCCAVALCFEFVASIPYSIDLQRYSGFRNQPSRKSYLPSNAQNPYQYSDNRYRIPSQQKQEQQLPNVNRENYFARNQQRYLPKGPPQQAETLNGKYNNPQYNPVHEIYPVDTRQNNREVLVPNPPQSIGQDPFIPEIPAVPSRVTYPNEAFRRNEADTHRFREIELPVIRPPPTQEHVERVSEVDNLNRLLARASNPVELIPQTKTQKPSIELYLSHPKIREVLSNTRHKKRFLVIHPDGRVEHVDKLETIAEKHPNYFLVNAGEIVANLQNKKPATPAPQIIPIKINGQKLKEVTPYNAIVETPIETPATVETEAHFKNPQPVPVNVAESPKDKPSTVKVEPVISEPSTRLPTDITTEVPLTPTELPVPSTLPPVDTTTKTPLPTTELSEPSTLSPVVATTEVPLTTTEYVPIKPIQSSEIADDKEVLPTHTEADINGVVTELSTEEVSTITPTPVIASTPKDTTTTEQIEDPKIIIADPVFPQAVTENSIVHQDDTTTQSPEPNLTANEIKVVPSPLPPTDAPYLSVDNQDQIKEVDTPDEATEIQEVPAPQEDPVENDETDQEAKVPVEDHSVKNNTAAEPKSTPVEEVLSKLDEYIVEEASQYTPSPDVPVPNFGDLDISKIPHKPSLWFRTKDPNFWDQLTEQNKGLDVVYFFQIHNQPKIEKDVKTTIHPNGTVVEDVIQSIWAFEGDEPTITKTTKIIHPEDL